MELNRGGRIDASGEKAAIVPEGYDYIIPKEFAKRWGQAILDSINKEVLDFEEHEDEVDGTGDVCDDSSAGTD